LGRFFFWRWLGAIYDELWAFFEGCSEKMLFLRGVFVVKLWWIRGKSWVVDGRFSVG
jgi:hypothetical protein